MSSKILAYNFLYSADVFGSEYYKNRTNKFIYVSFVDNIYFPLPGQHSPLLTIIHVL